MIRKLYIIQEAGVCSLFIDFTCIQCDFDNKMQRTSDPQLISGFFSAIIAFADEAIGTGDQKTIDSISVKNVIYYFKKLKDYYFILELDSLDSASSRDDIEELLTQIGDLFTSYMDQGLIENPDFMEIQNQDFINTIKSLVSKTARKSLFKKSNKK